MRVASGPGHTCAAIGSPFQKKLKQDPNSYHGFRNGEKKRFLYVNNNLEFVLHQEIDVGNV